MQILDNSKNAPSANKGPNNTHNAGACYDMYPADKKIAKPLGEWNQVRIVAAGDSITFFLNRKQTASFRIGSPEWKARVAKSRFAGSKTYAQSPAGHIVLQDHGSVVAFRNIKIRELR